MSTTVSPTTVNSYQSLVERARTGAVNNSRSFTVDDVVKNQFNGSPMPSITQRLMPNTGIPVVDRTMFKASKLIDIAVNTPSDLLKALGKGSKYGSLGGLLTGVIVAYYGRSTMLGNAAIVAGTALLGGLIGGAINAGVKATANVAKFTKTFFARPNV